MLSIMLLTPSEAAVAGAFRIGAMFPLYKTGSSSPPFAEDRSGMHRFAAMRLAIEEVSLHTIQIVWSTHSFQTVQPLRAPEKSPHTHTPHTHTHTEVR